jgi:ribosomal protein S18 acetylase RimI-like enzyme
MNIRNATLEDVPYIRNIYESALECHPHNLMPYTDELTNDFIANELKNSLARGYAIVIEKEDKVIGYSKAYASEYLKKSHILTNATFVFSKEWQNTIIPYTTLQYIREYVYNKMPHILLFEVAPYSFNKSAIRIYEKIGFKKIFETQNTIKLNNGEYTGEVFLQLKK